MYLNLPDLFTIRIEIKKKSDGERLFLGFVTLEKDAWSIDIVNDGELHDSNSINEHSDILKKIFSEDAFKNQLPRFRRNERPEYTFDNTYKSILQGMYDSDINSNFSPSKLSNFMKSPFSPVSVARNASGEHEFMPVEMYIGDIERHSVEGLKNLASDRNRFSSSQINDSGFRKISNLEDEENSQRLLTIGEQLLNSVDRNQFITNQIPCRRMVNDTVDRAHDFIYINRETIDFNAYQTGCGEEYTKKLTNDLLSSESNINVPNSHSIQENNITDLHIELKKKDIIVPSLPKDIFVSRRFVFADFVEFLFKALQLSGEQRNSFLSGRNHYAESGKQVTLRTLDTYLTDLENNPEEKDLFLIDIQRLTNSNNDTDTGLLNIDSIRDLITEIQDLVKNQNYPIISKNCYQQMDGCSTGPSHFGSSLPKARIDGIFGLYDIHLENKSCNENQQVNTIIVSKGEDIVYTIDVVGEITLDKVVRSILAFDNNVKYKFRGVNSVDGSIFPPLPTDMTNSEKILILMALKTFCDKLYRLSMENEKKLTHIFTIDSYVYGDPYLQYLLAEETYCPAVLRSAQGIVHDVEKMEDDRVTINNLCKQDVGKIKGFWYRPSIGIENSEKGYLENLYERFACYFCILINTVDNLRETYPDIYNYITSEGGVFNKKSAFYNIHSHRVNNYFDRIAYFWTNYKSLSDFNPNNKLDYNEVMGHLTYLEICKVFNDVKEYIRNSSKIYLEINPNVPREGDDLLVEEIRKFLIQVSDLENLLQLSSPTIFVENQEIGVNIDQNDDLRVLYANDKKECQDIFGIKVEENEKSKDSQKPVFNFINYDEETDKIQYTITKNNTRRTKYNSFTLEFAIYLYNDMLSRDVGNKEDTNLGELKNIIIQKINTLKDLIGIKRDECRNIQDFIKSQKQKGVQPTGDIFKVKKANNPDDKRSSKRTVGQRSPNKTAETEERSVRSRQLHNAGSGVEISFPSGVGMSGETSYQEGDDVYNPLIPDSGADTSPIRGNNKPSPGRVSRDRRRTSAPREEMNDNDQGQNIFGTKKQPPKGTGGKKRDNKQTHRVKKRLRKTINKISKMTHKNKTKRRRKNRRKTRKL